MNKVTGMGDIREGEDPVQYVRGSSRKRQKLDHDRQSFPSYCCCATTSSSFSSSSSSSSFIEHPEIDIRLLSSNSSSINGEFNLRHFESSSQPFYIDKFEAYKRAQSRGRERIEDPRSSHPARRDCLPHLPHDLIISNIVASRLSVLDLIRARAVCRSWRDSIFSPTIAESFVANPDCMRSHLLVEHTSASGPSIAVYDSLVRCWSVVPLPNFGRLVAASSGLFCILADPGRPPSLVVGNPLTNRWKHLPEIPLSVPAHGPQLIAMVAENSTGTFKVVVLFGIWADDATDAYLPFVYESASDKWAQRSNVSASLSFATSRSVVKSPGILLSVDSNADSILSYNIASNVGHTLRLQRSPSFNKEDPKTNLWRRLPQIAICQGMPFLVARCVGERAPVCKLGQLPIVQHSSIGVWRVEDGCDSWEFVTCMPLDLLEALVKGSDGTDFIVASNGDSNLFFVLKGSAHMLAYDPSSSSWTLLPGCPADYNTYPLHQSAFYEPLVWAFDL
ncbi:hypothetical protein KP509_05G092600 [Ceratopteris richardii]|nr:hypothetical protein KP509_05G092600 [Ceratopteris richardii]